MTKSELVSHVSEQTGLTKVDAEKALEAVIGGIKKGVVEEEKVTLKGFGTFLKQHREARVGRNPQTGGEVNIPAKNVVKFKPSSEFEL